MQFYGSKTPDLVVRLYSSMSLYILYHLNSVFHTLKITILCGLIRVVQSSKIFRCLADKDKLIGLVQ